MTKIKSFDTVFPPMTNQRLGGAKNQGQNSLMNIGYARVSTEYQNSDLQLAAIKKAECEYVFAGYRLPAGPCKRQNLTPRSSRSAKLQTFTTHWIAYDSIGDETESRTVFSVR